MLEGQLGDEHARSLNVNPFVLDAQHDGPVGAGLIDVPDGVVAGIGNDLLDEVVDLSAVPLHLLDRGPGHLVLAQVVPAHLIHTSLEERLEVGIDALLDQARHPQLVHIERGGVTVIEYLKGVMLYSVCRHELYHGMAELMVGWPHEGLLVSEAAQERLGDGPGVDEVVRERLLAAVLELQLRQGANGTVRAHSRHPGDVLDGEPLLVSGEGPVGLPRSHLRDRSKAIESGCIQARIELRRRAEASAGRIDEWADDWMGSPGSVGDGAQQADQRRISQLLAPAAGEYLGGEVDGSHGSAVQAGTGGSGGRRVRMLARTGCSDGRKTLLTTGELGSSGTEEQ